MATKVLSQEKVLFDEAVADGLSSVVFEVSDARNIGLSVHGSDSPIATIKFMVSNEDEPDFASASSKDNQIVNVALKDYNNTGTVIAGDTGIVYAGTAKTYILEPNSNRVRWITAIISGYSAGKITVKAYECDNE